MAFIKNSFLTLLLAVIMTFVFGMMSSFLSFAPPEVAGTADSLAGVAEIFRPGPSILYAALLFLAALVVTGVHALTHLRRV